MEKIVRKICNDYIHREHLITELSPCKFRDDLIDENCRLMRCVHDAIDLPDYYSRQIIISIAKRLGYNRAGITIMCEKTFKRYKSRAVMAIMEEYQDTIE